jgi:RsmE family RNA methyltransferase
VNLLLFKPGELSAENSLTVSDTRLTHLHSVLNSQPGDSIKVGEIGGRMGRGFITQLDENSAELQCTLTEPPPEKIPVTLILALPRPKMLRRILRAIAEFGVAELHLINSYRVEKSYWQTPVLAPEVIEDYLLQGLSQSRDTILPTVHCHQRFKPFVEDQLPTLLADRQGFLAHPGDYPACPRQVTEDSLLVIGPEGGFIPYEVEKLEQAGCQTVSLGPRILRVENAVTSLLGRLA